MKFPTLLAGGAVLGLLLMAPQATEAQLTLADAPDCGEWTDPVASTGSVSWLHCGGSFVGNDTDQDVEGWIWTNWGLDVSLYGKTDGETPEELGPFVGFTDGMSTGTLEFSSPVSGMFVLSLKAGDQFSLYHFDTMGDSWTTLSYSTIGVSLNAVGDPQALSHASFYSAVQMVPEPASVLLLLSGLVGIGIVARRRNEVA